jgi:signal transduction histidine kinase
MYINRATHCCIQLVEIVNDILDFSKLMAGKGQIDKQCLSFKEIIDEINSVMGQRIKEKKQKLHYVIDDKLPSYIVADKQKIVQILVNLVSNSNKFSLVGSRIIVQIEPSKDNTITFSVEDNGIGLSRE